jgi:hypothetical protein
MWVVGYSSEGYPYYTNTATGESTWERPDGYVEEVASGDAMTVSVVGGGQWTLAADKKGNPFYYDSATGESRWAQPEDWVEQGGFDSHPAFAHPARTAVRAHARTHACMRSAGLPCSQPATSIVFLFGCACMQWTSLAGSTTGTK